MAFGNKNLLLLVLSISSLLLSVATAQSFDDFSSSPAASPAAAADIVSTLDNVQEGATTEMQTFSTASTDESSMFATSKAVNIDDAANQAIKSLETEGQVFKFVESNMIGTMNKIQEFVDKIQKRLDDPSLSDVSSTKGLEQCKEVYQNAMDDAKNILDDLYSRDFYKANVDLSVVSSNIDSCEDGFAELGRSGEFQDANFKQFGEWVRGMTGDCLDAIQKFSS